MSDTDDELEEKTAELNITPEPSELQPEIDPEIVFPEASGSVQVSLTTEDQGAEEFPFQHPLDLSNPTEVVDELGKYAVTENPEYVWLLPNLPASSVTAGLGASGWVEVDISELTVGEGGEYDPGPQIKCVFYDCDDMFYSHDDMLLHIQDHCNTKPAEQTPALPANTTAPSSSTLLSVVQQFFEEREKRTQLQKALQEVRDKQSRPKLQEMPREEVRPKQVRFDSRTLIRPGRLSTRILLPDKAVRRGWTKPTSDPTTPPIKKSPLVSEKMASNAPTSKDTTRGKRGRIVIFCAFESCFERFRSYPEMHMHFRTHETAYICTECWKAFGSVTRMKLHDNLHMQFKPYRCSFDFCGRRFSLSADLRKHTPSHCDGDPYICPYFLCADRFPTRDLLEEHIITHVGT